MILCYVGDVFCVIVLSLDLDPAMEQNTIHASRSSSRDHNQFPSLHVIPLVLSYPEAGRGLLLPRFAWRDVAAHSVWQGDGCFRHEEYEGAAM